LRGTALEGSRARSALCELEEFLKERGAVALAGLLSAKTPDDAYRAACEYKAAYALTGKLEAAVSAGEAAKEELMGMEED
jgi:hypothetical protein